MTYTVWAYTCRAERDCLRSTDDKDYASRRCSRDEMKVGEESGGARSVGSAVINRGEKLPDSPLA